MLLSNAYSEYVYPPSDWVTFSVQLLITEIYEWWKSGLLRSALRPGMC